MHRTEGANNINNLYTEGPPATTVTAAAMNAIQEEISNVVEGTGLVVQKQITDTRDQLWQAIQTLLGYDAIIDNSTAFVNLFERTGANAYKIKDEYKSILLRDIGVDYNFLGALTNGDTYGIISTNNCKKIHCEPGVAISVGDTASGMIVNTDYCELKHVWLKGTGSSAAAIGYSFQLDASYVVFDNCKSTDRKSNAAFYVFDGSSATATQQETSIYNNCICDTVSTNTTAIYGFNECNYISNCKALNIDFTGTDGSAAGFFTCDYISNCRADGIDNIATLGSGTTVGFNTCTNISSSIATNITTSATSIRTSYGFYTCDNISSCIADTISSNGTSGQSFGFAVCNNISACKATLIGGTSSNFTASGFNNCFNISSCLATNITATSGAGAHGFQTCHRITACYAHIIDNTSTGAAYGFNNSDNIAACKAHDIDSVGGTAYGFYDIRFGASLDTAEPNNILSDYIDTTDASITNKTSAGQMAWS
jgi:hypothetical protein